MSATLVGAVFSDAGEVVVACGAGTVVVRCSTFLGSAPATASTTTTAPTARAPIITKKTFEIRLMAVILAAEGQRGLRTASAVLKSSGRRSAPREPGAHPLAPARPCRGRAKARGRGHRGADLCHPLLERQLAGDQPVERVGHRRLDLRALEGVGEHRD